MAAKLDRLKWIICKVYDPKRRCLEEGGQYNIFCVRRKFSLVFGTQGKKNNQIF